MNYFQPYLPPLDDAIVAAWDSQIAEAAETPLLSQALTQSAELFPRFAACYAQLRVLPRGARRALQRQLARSSELTAVSPEWRRKLAASLAGAALLLALAQGAQAATITVNIADPAVNTLDTKCSLIEAIINAEHDNQDGSTQCAPGLGADTIVLAKIKKKPLNITLTTYYSDPYYSYAGLPIITGQITIMGNGGKIVRSGAAPQFRIATVSPTGSLTLQNLTLSGGNTYVNGGAINNLGMLVIDKAIISGNTASNGGAYASNAGAGGGVYTNRGTLTITNSTIAGNTATNGTGYAPDSFGGGVYNSSAQYHNYLTLNRSLISGNSATNGSEIANFEDVSSYVLYVPLPLFPPLGTTVNIVTANNFNLFGNNGNAGIYDPNGVSGLTPGVTDVVPPSGVTLSKILGPLKANGGLTQTRALVAKTSPALKKVTIGCPATDQRGTMRPQPRNTPCDIGSFEQR
jgi:hypothetical protein